MSNNDSNKSTDLSFRTLHVSNIKFFCKSEICNSFKTLLKMRLNFSWVFGLREDLKHFIIGQEEESREVQTLLLQICIQSLFEYIYWIDTITIVTLCIHLSNLLD